MAKDQIDELEKKKRKLQSELNELHDELDSTMGQVRSDISSQLDPKSFIRKYPLPIVGASALLGFLLGHKSNSSDKRKSTDKSTSRDNGFTSALLYELKRRATRRAVSFATDYVENLLEKKAARLSSTDTEEENE